MTKFGRVHSYTSTIRRWLWLTLVDFAELTFSDDDASQLGSEANTFTKGSLSTGAKGLFSMIVDPAATPCCELRDCNAEDDGE
uniref:Uncharacterized protein n=1 Tax=Tanacetum cinerariifolium TaxID=118510 RepID=A0A699REY8_TANCI|nr:hypothetical protein [Tanacetum cinerariifolium]